MFTVNAGIMWTILHFSETRLINAVSKIRDDLNYLNDWSVENELLLNPSTCQIMQLYFRREGPPPCFSTL